MTVGIATRAPKEWIAEFRSACETLGVHYRLLDISRNDWMDGACGLDGLMWRIHLGDPCGLREAAVKIPMLEAMGVRCFPNAEMARLYDTKIAQAFFFRRNRYPTPETFVSYSEDEALDYVAAANYPIVAKTSGGASSSGVSLVRTRSEAERIVKGVFGTESRLARALRTRGASALRATSSRLWRTPGFLTEWSQQSRGELERYVYFQEYLDGDGDLRVITLGPNVVSVIKRRNRPNDFRASGSGLWESFTEDTLPTEPCEMALNISCAQGFTSMAYDFLRSKRGWLITEISYSFILRRLPWDYTASLFERRGERYSRLAPIPIGVLHLKALLETVEATEPAPRPGLVGAEER